MVGGEARMSRVIGAILAAMVLAGCMGASPVSSPSATETAAPIPTASASAAPSGSGDATGEPTIPPGTDLAALLPTSVAGQVLTVSSVDGDEAGHLMTEHMGGSAGSVATTVGVEVSELEAAVAATPDADPYAEGGGDVVFAIRYPGADSAALTEAVAPVAGGMEWMSGEIAVTEETVGGREVSVLETSLTTHYFYAIGDVIFLVRTPDRAIAEEALSQLP